MSPPSAVGLHVLFAGETRSKTEISSVMASQDAPVSPLCALCREFADDVIRFAFTQPDEYPASSRRWLKDPAFNCGYLPWKDGFRHHDDLASLAASAQAGCALCCIVHNELAPFGPDDCKGFVVFHPFSNFTFRFRDSPSMQFRPAPWIEQPRLYEFCQRRSRLPGVSFEDPAFWKGHIDPWGPGSHAIPSDGASEDVFDTARWWLKSCVETHGDMCKRPVAPLPTRVVDVGVDDSCSPSLYISAGEYEPCAILTHCWGGGIPFKTTKATLQHRIKGMEMSQLPKNFQDAVVITRRLGLRYVWIDALCIIQDDPADWRREAAKMADIYAAGTVTISALDSPSSETGILHRRQALPEVVLSSEYTVRRQPRTFERVLADCPLNTRSWCLQEKLLSPALLHFGSQQIFWECRYQKTPEVAPTVHPNYNPPVGVRPFMGMEKYVPPEGPFWALWYDVVEAFSMRDLTFVTDKLPAIAGVGARFRQQNVGGTYAAGLWVEDLAKGICWGPAWDHLRLPARKATGFDRCEVLRKPSVAIAPSWSWASVDGRVSFFGSDGPWEFTILNVDMVDHDDLMTERSRGTLTIQGRFARVWYLPDSHAADVHQNIGRLVLKDDGNVYFTGAMLDLERDKKKECWAMVASARGPGSFTGFLLFEEQGSHFVRIGFCNEQNTVTVDMDKFAEMTIAVV